ncbi:hypothetical protein [Mesorhizobium sp.]|uniref:hypothetical protein n=1 Tax=Mesorhizobium sp. TaxID=1871066 RepID=UPI0025DC0483|nr:hypothetical protein [Mesorhizobium sp.]
MSLLARFADRRNSEHSSGPRLIIFLLGSSIVSSASTLAVFLSAATKPAKDAHSLAAPPTSFQHAIKNDGLEARFHRFLAIDLAVGILAGSAGRVGIRKPRVDGCGTVHPTGEQAHEIRFGALLRSAGRSA